MNKSLLNLVLPGLLATQLAVAADLRLDNGQLNASDLAVRQQLASRLAEISASPEQYEDALYHGQRRASLCKVCHGDDGNSVKEGTPNLAGQDPVYIVDQFNRYADGRRIDYWMGSLAASFSDEDKIKLAIFYAAQTTKPARGGNDQLIERGRRIYQNLCVECHGDDGRNEEGYARLAGQRPEYTAKMLKEFRTPTGRRYNPLMYARAFMLRSDEEIEAVATYLAHLD
ncbi:MAG: c-type cytochrome [Gammaproteobacteria bacterium]|nr:c-type cytochrome [Gammaproteobacteria bacterium]